MEIIPKAIESCIQCFVEKSDSDLEQIPLENQHNLNTSNSSEEGKTNGIHLILKSSKIPTFKHWKRDNTINEPIIDYNQSILFADIGHVGKLQVKLSRKEEVVKQKKNRVLEYSREDESKTIGRETARAKDKQDIKESRTSSKGLKEYYKLVGVIGWRDSFQAFVKSDRPIWPFIYCSPYNATIPPICAWNHALGKARQGCKNNRGE